MFAKVFLTSAALLAAMYISSGQVYNRGYLSNLLNNPLVKCRLYGGSCTTVSNCDTTTNIYKDTCKQLNYDNVCCIPRTTVCQKFSGFCTNESSVCISAGNLFNKYGPLGGQPGYGQPRVFQTVALSWLACNSTHRCCHPVRINRHPHGQGYNRGSALGRDAVRSVPIFKK